MTTHPRERDRRRARERPVVAERHRRRERARRAARRPPAAETGREAGEISPVARTRGVGAESERSGSRGGRLRSSIPG